MEINIQNYEYLNELLKIAQNCLKVLIPAHKNLLKIAQTYLKVLISTQKKLLKIVPTKIRSKLLKIAEK